MQIAITYDAAAIRQIAGCESMSRVTVGNAIRQAAQSWSDKMGGTAIEVHNRAPFYPYDASAIELVARVDGPESLRVAVHEAIAALVPDVAR